ncbi:uncharacterized protein LOC6557575 [Drosophila grimshawi]|uniref:uncharacterized protein LOC6557575 n=1 Tax=Drosophila grimshawi TaxID=7222 RepID=UPI001C931C2A|nr:uncharacterized protein LOC6557575 [Drosophila grimshawi]
MLLHVVLTQLLLLLLVLLLVGDLSDALTVNEALQRSYQEQHYDTVLLMRHNRQQQCSQMEEVAADTIWPVIRLSNQANFYLKRSQSTEMLAITCLTGNSEMDMEIWQALAKNLYNMRHVRLLLLLQEATAVRTDPLDQLLKSLANITFHLHFPHVVLLLPEGNAYQLHPYEEQLWLELQLNSSAPIFARQYNFHRYLAKVLPDQTPPGSLAYKDRRTGKLRITGYLAKTILAFAWAHNITLQWARPLVIGDQLSLIVLRNLTLNGTINFAMSLCGFELPNESGYYTYPIELPAWFVVLPCAREIATAEVYLRISNINIGLVLLGTYCIFVLLDTCFGWLLMKEKVDWTNFVLNERIFSGIIGQSFKLNAHSTNSARLAQAQLFLFGLIVSTLFSAHLKTLLTKRPRDHLISNLMELRDSKLNIYFSEGEDFYLRNVSHNHPINTIKSKIKYLEVKEFQKQRKSFNKSNAFSMTTSIWLFIKSQQEVFQQPALCFQPGLVFRKPLIISLALQANSIFAEPMNTFIHRMHDAGLAMQWKQQSLRDFIALGETSLNDPYLYVPFHDFKVVDLFWGQTYHPTEHR